MSGFDGPGEGWREVNVESAHPGVERVVYLTADDVRGGVWVREEPVPPLPIEPYTVIRVTWRGGRSERAIKVEGTLWETQRAGEVEADYFGDRITGFEVLAEPRKELDREAEYAAVRDVVRREIARAVLDRVRERIGRGAHAGFVDDIAREFGVEVSS